MLQEQSGFIHVTRGQPDEECGDQQKADEPLEGVQDPVGGCGRLDIPDGHVLGPGDRPLAVVVAGGAEHVTAHSPVHGHPTTPEHQVLAHFAGI